MKKIDISTGHSKSHNINTTKKQPNYLARRVGVAVTGLAVAGISLVGGKAIAEKVGSDVDKFEVNLEELYGLSPEERDARYETIVVRPGAATFDQMAREFIDEHDLKVDKRDVITALAQQGDPGAVQEGQKYYLQRQDIDK